MGLLEYSFGMIELAMGTDGLLLHGFDRFSAEFSLMAIRRNMVRAMLLFGFGGLVEGPGGRDGLLGDHMQMRKQDRSTVATRFYPITKQGTAVVHKTVWGMHGF